MKFSLHSYRNARALIEGAPHLAVAWSEITSTVSNIDTKNLLKKAGPNRSISQSLRNELGEGLARCGWVADVPFVYNPSTSGRVSSLWTINYVKPASETLKRPSGVALNIETGHITGAAWALTKVSLAIELTGDTNHTRVGANGLGVVITVKDTLRKIGRMDGAATTYERVIDFLNPMRMTLHTPIIIMGLE